MRSIQLDEQKKVQLDILKYFADFCDKNGLQYYLAYGTLLGAIRHKGYIPWDDDIDVCMPIKDYNKAIELFNEYSKESLYKLVAPSDKISKISFVKVTDERTVKIETAVNYKNNYIGIDIDVFPLEGAPETKEEFYKWCKKLVGLYTKAVFKARKVKQVRFITTCKTLLLKLLYFRKRSDYLKMADRLHAEYPYDKADYVGIVCTNCQDSFDSRFKKEWFKDYILVEYEGQMLKAPIGYHEVLTAIYGDYMTPPPPEKRITHHANNVFWKD